MDKLYDMLVYALIVVNIIAAVVGGLIMGPILAIWHSLIVVYLLCSYYRYKK